MDLPVDGMAKDFRIFSRSGSALRVHGATLIPSELSSEQRAKLCGDLDALREALMSEEDSEAKVDASEHA